MSYEPLHHKYRPQTFADLVGQEAIATTLTNAILSRRIAPAYLFTGPRGTGKTSSARILAKSLNCLSSPQPTPSPCGSCEVCRAIARGSALDVIEIDAASNTGVDNIREIIERSQFAPVQCRYKVYAIDECHMLSTAAFNALLKTLEEPPDRVIFVLATTDPQRVLPTIISRCQRFDYRRIPLESMVAHLQYIATQETIEIEKEAIILVAQIANGGLRDAESLLDQLSLLSGTITAEKVWDLVGAVPERDLLALVQAIASDNPQFVLDRCRHLMNRGREPLVVLQNLANFYLNLLIAKTAPDRADLVAVTASTWQELQQEVRNWDLNRILQGQQHLKESESQLKQTTQPRLWLEVTLLGLLPSAAATSDRVPTTASSRPASERSRKEESPNRVVEQTQSSLSTPNPAPATSPIPSTPVTVETSLPVPTPPPPPTPQTSEPASTSESIDRERVWQTVLDRLPTWTQALVRPYCHLIRFEGMAAYIGVKTEPLLRHAQGKTKELETAFEAVCHHKVKVHLQVIGGTDSRSTPTEHPVKPSSPPTPPIPTKSAVSVEDFPSIRDIAQIEAPPPSPPLHSNGHSNGVKSEQNGKTVTQPEAIAIASPQSPIDSSDRPNEPSDTDESETEIQKAAESLAKYFEGEIAILERDIQEEEPASDREQIGEIASQLPASKSLLEIPRSQSSEIDKPAIRGRPELDPILDDDEDLPF